MRSRALSRSFVAGLLSVSMATAVLTAPALATTSPSGAVTGDTQSPSEQAAGGRASAGTSTLSEADLSDTVQLLPLTTSQAKPTDFLEEQEVATASTTSSPAGTSTGQSLSGSHGNLLARTLVSDVESEAALLTDPLEVDGFYIAGFTWNTNSTLPAGTRIYLRVREQGTWTPWFEMEESDAVAQSKSAAEGETSTARRGTDEFVTAGADAVQAAILGDPGSLPADLTMALVPSQPRGEDVLEAKDVESLRSVPETGVADAAEQSTSVSPASQALEALTSASRTASSAPASQSAASPDSTAGSEAAPSASSEGKVNAGTSAGSALASSRSARLLAATNTATLPVNVTSRAGWGANESVMTWPASNATAGHVVVHHTAGTNNYTAAQSAGIVAGIYHYHAVTLGWGDIGYNFLVDKYGQAFEGRKGSLAAPAGQMPVGAHALGVNTGTVGISMMGDYSSVTPSGAQINTVGKLAGWYLGRAGYTNVNESAPLKVSITQKFAVGQSPNLPRIIGHRDVGYTTCPGNAGYAQLGTIRNIASSQASQSPHEQPVPTTNSWRLSNGQWQLVTPGGQVLTGWQQDKGQWYYLGSDGVMRTGWQIVGGRWYYLDSSGAMATGWKAIGGRRYFLEPSGAMATGWKLLGSTWFYLDSSGAAATGWRLINGRWYYFENSGAMLTAWQDIAGTRYYFTANGDMVTGWQSLGGRSFHFASSGALNKGWLLDRGTWYYLDPADGHMHTGWAKVGQYWYFLNASGAMRTGWQQIGGSWYYLHGDGHMDTGWLQLGSTWYYLSSSGAMVTGQHTVDGRVSSFAPSGAWQGYSTASVAASNKTARSQNSSQASSASSQHSIMSAPAASKQTTTAAMVRAYQSSGATYPAADLGRGGAGSIEAFAGLVYDEAVAEGVSPELLFAQAMKETGWLRFGGDVTVSQYNFGGIGATGGGKGGARFASVREGLRAQVQHLRAYADPSVTQAKLANPLVDPRFAYVRKGSARYVEHLGVSENPQGVGWAAAKGYGTSLASMMNSIFGI